MLPAREKRCASLASRVGSGDEVCQADHEPPLQMRGKSLFTGLFDSFGTFLAKSGRLIPHQNSQVSNILQKLFHKQRVSCLCVGLKSHNRMSQLVEVALGSRTPAAERDVLS